MVPPFVKGGYESMDGRGRATHDCMDAGVRATQDAKAEEQLPRRDLIPLQSPGEKT